MISWHVNMTWSVVISGHIPVEPLSPKDGDLRPQRGGALCCMMGTSVSEGWEPPFRWASPFQNQAGGFWFDI